MKKELLLALVYLFFFSFLGWGQRTTWKLNFKTNYSIVDIENSTYYFAPLAHQSDPLQVNGTHDFNRKGKGKFGFELGLLAKVKLEDGINIISGLETKFIHFDRIEELDKSNFNSFDPSGLLEFGYVREIIGNQISDPIDFKLKEGEFQQQLIYLNIPLNFGYSTKSDRWTFYGGLWYSRLISTIIEGYENYNVDKSNELFNKNIIGYNVGFDVNVFQKIGLTANYNGVVSNIYGMEKQNHPNSLSAHIISFGMTYQLN